MFASRLIDQVHDFWATSVILIGAIVSFSPAWCVSALLSCPSSWQVMVLDVFVLTCLLSELSMVSYAIDGLPNVVRTVHAYV